MSAASDLMPWVLRAEEDYAAAVSAMRRKKPLTYIACFHAQQCAEKYLKALLITRGHEPPRVHDMVVLGDECTRAGILLSVSDDDLSTLSAYAVRVRYPGDDPTVEEARQALHIAKRVRRFARGLLGLA
jgi:HEPN domain-containing protein